MPTTRYTLTGSLRSLAGLGAPGLKIREAFLTTNVPLTEALVDYEDGPIQIGPMKLVVTPDGSINQPNLLPTNAPDLSHQNLQYAVVVKYVNPIDRNDAVYTSPWFELEGNLNLKDIIETGFLPVVGVSAILAQMTALRDQMIDLSNIDTPDELVGNMIDGLLGLGAATRAALDRRYVSSVVATLHKDGGSDAGTYLTGLAQSTAAFGAWLRLDGVYRCDTQFKHVTGLKVDAGDSDIIRNYDSPSSGIGSALFGNADVTVKSNDVIVIGGNWRTSATTGPNAKRGSIFGFYGDRWLLRDVNITSWTKGRAIDSNGDDHRGYNIRATGSTGLPGDGGWRVLGGKRGRAIGCHIESGDDVYQFVPSGGGSVSAPQLFSKSIEDWYFIACTGKCTGPARLMNASLQNRDPNNPMTASIKDCGWINVNGEGGTSYSVLIANYNSSGSIDGIRVTDCAVNGRSVGQSEVLIARYPDGPTPGSPSPVVGTLGKVNDIRFTNFRLHNPKRCSVMTRGGVSNVSFLNCDLEPPGAASNVGVSVTKDSPLIVAPMILDEDGLPLQPPWGDGTTSGAITAPGLFPAGTLVKSVSADGYTITAGDAAGNNVNALANNANATVQIGGTRTGFIRGCNGFSYIGGSIGGGGNGHTMLLGGPDIVGSAGTSPGRVTKARISGVDVYDVPNNYTGVLFNYVTNGRLTETTVTGMAGETTAYGVRVNANSAECSVRNNHLLGIATAANRLADVAASVDTDKANNRGVQDSGIGAIINLELAADTAAVNNDNTTYFDTLITVALPPGTWAMRGLLRYAADANADLGIRFNTPADAVGDWTGNGLSPATAANAAAGSIGRESLTWNQGVSLGGVGVGVVRTALPEGRIKTITGGTFTLRYSQGVQHASDAKIMARTAFTLTRVA